MAGRGGPWIVAGVGRGSPAIHSYALRTDEQAVAHLHFSSGDVDLRRKYLAILAAIEAHLENGFTADGQV